MENREDQYRRKNPFSVPEGYFEQLTGRIQERIQEEERPQKIRAFSLIKPYLGLAAIFAIVFMIVQVLLPRVIGTSAMLEKNGDQVVTVKEPASVEEFEFDSGFNPTSDEILEYLSTEIEYEVFYADLY